MFAYSFGIFRYLSFTSKLSRLLIQRLQKFHAYQIDSVRGAMAQHTCLYGGSFCGQRRGGRRRGRDRQIYDLIRADGPRARKIGPRGAYIKRLREVEEFQSGGVRPSDEHWNLYMNPLRTPALSGGQAHTFSF